MTAGGTGARAEVGGAGAPGAPGAGRAESIERNVTPDAWCLPE